MNLDQSCSNDYKLRNINTEMRHYKCLAFESIWITRSNGYRIAGAKMAPSSTDFGSLYRLRERAGRIRFL
jgi:hypothetical protein